MAYMNRNNFKNFWAIPRKGTKYVAVSTHNVSESIPLMIVMRDIFKLVRTKKELAKIINEKQIKINGKEIRKTNYPLCLFDILTLIPMKKSYKVLLSKNKKYIFEEIDEKDAKSKIYKVLDKRLIGNKKIQLNLIQGKNIISEKKVNIGDTVVLDFENNILKILSLGNGKKAMVTKGKHMGSTGIIEKIIERGGKKLVKIASGNEKINVWIKNVIVIE